MHKIKNIKNKLNENKYMLFLFIYNKNIYNYDNIII